jgi:hypothetical protein
MDGDRQMNLSSSLASIVHWSSFQGIGCLQSESEFEFANRLFLPKRPAGRPSIHTHTHIIPDLHTSFIFHLSKSKTIDPLTIDRSRPRYWCFEIDPRLSILNRSSIDLLMFRSNQMPSKSFHLSTPGLNGMSMAERIWSNVIWFDLI